jgi:hypothetical protein
MKYIRRIAFALALTACAISIVLLLNITAPNPTGRRYSSRPPLSTGQGSVNQIGLDGERVLANDLRLPRNDAPDQRQCICSSQQKTDPNTCRVCIVSVEMTSPYRRPDFIAPTFIAEAKNARDLFYDSRDLPEIIDYALAARALKRPLWVFTRVNTNIDPEFTRVVAATGGEIIQYFTVPGYIDPTDRTAKDSLLVSVAVIALSGLWEWAAQHKQVTYPKTPQRSADPLQRAIKAVTEADKFTKDSKDRHKDRLD